MTAYRVVVADTPELLAQAYEVRHLVYCEETHLLDGTDLDDHEGRSVHTLLTHVPTETAIGTVRLVMPTDRSPLRMAEVTRVCLSRARIKELALSRDRPLLFRLLISGVIEISQRFGVEYWFAYMQPGLARRFPPLGIEFESIGPEIELSGARRAHYCRVSDAVAGMILKDSFANAGLDAAICPMVGNAPL